MILTDQDVNALLVRLSAQHNLREEDEVTIQEKGWSLRIRYSGGITADLRDCFNQPVSIPADVMIMIENGIIIKLEL